MEQFKQIKVEENGVVSSSKMQTENKDPTEYNQTYHGCVSRKSVSANHIIYPLNAMNFKSPGFVV